MALNRATAARVLLFALSAVLVALLTARLLFDRAIDGLGPSAQMPQNRLLTMIDALPTVVSERDALVLVIGASRTAFGFSPEVFERALPTPVKAYNLGIPAATPRVIEQLTGRLEHQLAQANKRAHLTIVEFTPYLATTRSREHTVTSEVEKRYSAEISDTSQLLTRARRSPSAAAEQLTLASFHLSPGLLRLALGSALIDRAPSWWPWPDARSPEAEAKANMNQRAGALRDQMLLAQAKAESIRPGAFTLNTRGEPRTLTAQTQASYAAMMTLQRSADYLRWHKEDAVQRYDILDLGFSDEAIGELSGALQHASVFSDHTLLLLMPLNHSVLETSALGKQRLAAVLQRLGQQTTVLDLEDAPGFGPEDFEDATHLSEDGGRAKLSALLAKAVADQNWK